MSLNVIRYSQNSTIAWGLLEGDKITPLKENFATTGDLIRYADEHNNDLPVLKQSIDLSDVSILSPVTRNQQFVCQGANYRQHMIESGMNPDEKNFNMIFRKASSCITHADSDVVKPAHVRFLDYEVELGIIIKRPIEKAIKVTSSNLADYVAGIVIVNDYSARDVQIPQMQFYKGKSFRTFGPVGPVLCLLLPDEMHYLDKLQLCLTVNGMVRQKDTTANLVFKPDVTLTELSGVQDFNPGDLLATGTPAGCALSIPSQKIQKLSALIPEKQKWQAFMRIQKKQPYLNKGDLVETTIATACGKVDLGKQRNRVVEEGAV
ncbi:fumarylacetoacetate hydrolase [Gammaproteobacteria bacterium 42_54_T18]|nr:fumarylacetoacetate hydrolase [Gammaproteobacteria bacterium 42_54_T18]